MTLLISTLVALIWLVGSGFRIHRQARFYQIEEYDSLRYLRWLLRERVRWLPTRPLMARVVGTAFSMLLAEGAGIAFPATIGIVAALVGAWPAAEGEIKKPFRATARAKRMLGAAFVIATAVTIFGLWLLSLLPDDATLRLMAIGIGGWLVLILAPIFLIAGNLLMTPVEASLRRRFVARAKRALAEVHPAVIGITGSYGKTSTKTYLAHLLNGRYKVYATPKSYNTLMGVSMAINNDVANDHSIDYLIAEMGAYIPGEIERLCDLTHPTIGIVVEVGPQHLERFGSLDNVATAKYELIKGLPPDGVGIFNWDNPYVRAMAERGYPATRLTVSREADPSAGDGPRFIASAIDETLAGLTFTVTDRERGVSERFETALLGQHNVTNILLATAVAAHEGLSLREIALRVRGLQPAEARLMRQSTAEGITIINDAYSANPVGIIGALKVLSLHTSGKRVLITPGMVELGPLMDAENRRLGTLAAAQASDVVLVGAKQTAPIKAGLLDAGFDPARLQVVETLAEAIMWYQSSLQAGDTVLFLNDLPDTYSS